MHMHHNKALGRTYRSGFVVSSCEILLNNLTTSSKSTNCQTANDIASQAQDTFTVRNVRKSINNRLAPSTGHQAGYRLLLAMVHI